MTTTREYLIQGVRELLITALGLADAQVIPADDAGPRPAKEYLTVDVQGAGALLSREGVYTLDEDDAPQVVQRATLRTTATIRGYGRDAAEWIELFVLRLANEAVLDEATTRGISLEPLGQTISAAVTLDSGREERCVREFSIDYQITDETQVTLIALEQVVVTTTLDRYSGDPSALVTATTVDVS